MAKQSWVGTKIITPSGIRGTVIAYSAEERMASLRLENTNTLRVRVTVQPTEKDRV